MLNGITTRTSTPQEDAEPWPGGSARPVLDYLTGTLGMTGADARELLKAARTAQAETGPGTLADYPVPGGDAHLLIHYAPGSRAYRFKLTAPENEVPPAPTRNRDRAREPARPGRAAARPGNAGRQPGRRRRQRARPGAASPAGRGGTAGAGGDHGHYLAQRRLRRRRGGIPPCWTATSPATPWSASSPTRPSPRAVGGGDRRRGVRHLQRPPRGRRRGGAGLRLLRAQAAVAVRRRRRGRRRGEVGSPSPRPAGPRSPAR